MNRDVANDQPDVRFHREDGVATITLDRPADQNRLSRSVLLALRESWIPLPTTPVAPPH